MTQFLPLTAGGLTYVLAYDPSGTPNQKPSFTSTPVTTATEGGLYAYTAVATDPEDDEITYSLDTYPTGMTIGTYTGIIHWVPTSTDTEAVVVRATDSNGAYTTQSFDIVVGSFAAAGGVDIDAAWLADADNGGPSGPYYLGTKNKIYRLQTDVTTDGTAFAIINSGITFNLNGHTITYDNATPIVVTNGSFEAGTGSVATGWDFTHAPNAERFAGKYLKNEVYDGDYSLKFSSFAGDQYVESTGTVTLEANTTYSLSAMSWVDNWESGDFKYVSLIGQSGEPTITLSHSGAYSLSGIRLIEKSFTTGASGATYKIRVGATIPSGAPNYAAYFDDIKIQRTMTYGVAVSAHSWKPAFFPGITHYGTGTNATIVNGTILQGQDSGTVSHGILNYATLNTTVSNMSVTVSGANSSAIRGIDTTSWVITDNDVTSNVQTISSRASYDGTVIREVYGTVSHNRIHNGAHMGIYAIASTVSYNTIKLKGRYSNCYAILTRQNCDIHHNTIDCGTGEYRAEGILVGPNTSGIVSKVHDNTITFQLFPDNQEYNGPIPGGAYGIQVESGQDIEVYNNVVTAIGYLVSAYAFRMNIDGGSEVDYSENVYVHDNTFKAVLTGDPSTISTACLQMTQVQGGELVFEDNVLESNDQWIGRSDRFVRAVLTRCTLKATGDLEAFIPMESFNWQEADLLIYDDLKWVDTSYYDAASQTLMSNATVWNYHGFPDIYSSFIHSFTTTLRVADGSDTPLAGAAVVLTDKDDAEVYSGETGDDGTVDVVVDEFRTQGDVKTSYSPYTLSATYGELSGSQEFTADQIQTITAVVT